MVSRKHSSTVKKPRSKPASRSPAVPQLPTPSKRTTPFIRPDQRLAWALGASLLLHAVFIGVHFAAHPSRLAETFVPPLEVVLVNAKSRRPPLKADVLAQANLDGGGNTDAHERAKSMLPAVGDNTQERLALEQRARQLEQAIAQKLIARNHRTPQGLPTPAPQSANDTQQNQASQQQIQKLEAQIAQEWRAYQERPKRQFVGSRAASYRLAHYVDDWRDQVERFGNAHYPAGARGLYGKLTLTVGIRANGQVAAVRVDCNSGNRTLDAAAEKIVRDAAPYAVFPESLRRDTDELVITRELVFSPANKVIAQSAATQGCRH